MMINFFLIKVHTIDEIFELASLVISGSNQELNRYDLDITRMISIRTSQYRFIHRQNRINMVIDSPLSIIFNTYKVEKT